MKIFRASLAAALILSVTACGPQREVRVLEKLDSGSTSDQTVTREATRHDAPEDHVAVPSPLPLPTAADIAAAPDPFSMKGKTEAAVKAALGVATLLRREPPAQVWQYRGRICVLDLVLYPDESEGATLRVAHVEIRPVEGLAKVAPKVCAADVRQKTIARS